MSDIKIIDDFLPEKEYRTIYQYFVDSEFGYEGQSCPWYWVDGTSYFDDGYYNLGNIYNKLEKEDKAIENYNKVIELDNNYYKAHNNLGNIYRKKGLNKKAIEYYIATLEINPNYKSIAKSL